MVKITIVALQLFFLIGACSPAVERRTHSMWPTVKNSRWKAVRTVKKFWRELYRSKNKKAIVFFSASWCSPCHFAKWYWDKQKNFQDWNFIYFDLSLPYKHSEIALLEKLRPRMEKAQTNALPVCFVIIGAKPGKVIADFSKHRFGGGPECGRELRKFLKNNYQ